MNARGAVIAARRPLVIGVHLLLWTVSTVVAFLLRFEFDVPSAYWPNLHLWLVELLGIRVVVHLWGGMFHGLWRYSGTHDLLALIRASFVSSLLFLALVTFVGPHGLPRSILVIDALGSVALVGGLRLGIRTVRELGLRAAKPEGTRKRILVVGAGDAGEMLMREITRIHASKFEAVGFLDDDPAKARASIHGVPVLGRIADVARIVEVRAIDEIVVAMPSISGREMRRIVEACGQTKARVLTLPGVEGMIDGKVTMSHVQDVRIEDLLRRDPVDLDAAVLDPFLGGRRVLVTGAGGSIGSELCRQVARFGPQEIVLLEQAENALFETHRRLTSEFPDLVIRPVIADVCDSRRLEAVFARWRPQVVFHAAAHKHVPMMEWNPGEAVKNNVFGTKKVADMANRFGVEKFVMVSTDKAVNPTSIMGATKRIAEMYVQTLSNRTSTHYITVRFGNVLGSAGSVVPIFREQIRRGGPVLVTHPDMERFFMTIPEACQLVMQAGAMGEGGEIFVLDMGEPVKIVDLARDLIRLSGFEPDVDVDIRFTGLRPGEKLFEELATASEKLGRTKHPKIYVGTKRTFDWATLCERMDALHAETDGGSPEALAGALATLVPEFTPDVPPAAVAKDAPRSATALPAPSFG